jgi:alkylated DNA repair dioxygenase AlkB
MHVVGSAWVIATTQALAAGVETCLADGASVVRLLSEEGRDHLAAAAQHLAWRPARPVVGEGERRVYQDFELTQQFPADSPYPEAAVAIDAAIAAACHSLPPGLLPTGFYFNDLILQRYAPGSRGITPHRDHLRYGGLVALIILSGDGRFCLCRDRSGSNAREIAASPGDVLLMRAPGLAGSSDRPFHFLDQITKERLSFGLRWDREAARHA